MTVFFAGLLVLFGARLAGGYTSGLMMSGMMQISLNGYLFAMGAFTAAVPSAVLVYKKNRKCVMNITLALILGIFFGFALQRQSPEYY